MGHCRGDLGEFRRAGGRGAGRRPRADPGSPTASELAGYCQRHLEGQAGEVVRLPPGSYSELRMDSGVNFTGNVTFTSADPAHPTVINGIRLAQAKGVTFSNIELTPAPDTGFGIYLSHASRVNFDHVNVRGRPDGSGDAAMVRESSEISITNSEIHNIGTGINHSNSDHINFSNNTIHDIGVDGIRGGGSSFVTVSGNSFTSFHPRGADHPDAIQFWTSNVTGLTHDVTITNNTFIRGDGAPVQGIFVKDENSQGYKNITITGNALIGALYHGIFVGNGDHVIVSNNLVQGYRGQDSWIFVQNTTNSVQSNNVATSYKGEGNVGMENKDNSTTSPVSPGDARLLSAFQATHTTAELTHRSKH